MYTKSHIWQGFLLSIRFNRPAYYSFLLPTSSFSTTCFKAFFSPLPPSAKLFSAFATRHKSFLFVTKVKTNCELQCTISFIVGNDEFHLAKPGQPRPQFAPIPQWYIYADFGIVLEAIYRIFYL